MSRHAGAHRTETNDGGFEGPGTGPPTLPSLIIATAADLPAIVTLMNRAYRGLGATPGWSNETAYIDGDRTNEALLRQDLAASPDAKFLLWRLPSGDLQGCVWLEPLGQGVWYLGSLTVDPASQNAGRGRQLLAASEAWVQSQGGHEIKMTVVHVRAALIAWYTRRGYRLTDETEPFPYDDLRFGTPRRPDLHFAVLRKKLEEKEAVLF
jgi:ribosomal protein S18 acetylase RimI-like enzyme